MTAPAKVWEYRTLITNLAQRDLRSRYKKSLLGWAWSLINPATTLGIYTLVFGVFLSVEAPLAGNGHSKVFALYLFCALVGWNSFAGGVNTAMQSFLAAGGLLTRTYFPPEVPVVAGSLTVLTQTAVEAGILLCFMIAIGNIGLSTLLIVPILVLLTLFSFGIGLLVALLNVRYRDVAYLVAVGLQVLFYATPIVYSESIVEKHPAAATALKFNPMTHFVGAMRHAVYLLQAPTLLNWIVMVGATAFTVVVGWTVFAHKAPQFIEEI
ncbi:MAG TPA: ABC transporter permease [Microthrixaceae bacterium]|nr:ABC transporter permease [Microthrixaceae bacterium]HNI34390.1 ABC transporter permease [Microthrixaceae bacterium]